MCTTEQPSIGHATAVTGLAVSSAERQRRLGQVYAFLLDLAREKRVAEEEQAEIVARSAS